MDKIKGFFEKKKVDKKFKKLGTGHSLNDTKPPPNVPLAVRPPASAPRAPPPADAASSAAAQAALMRIEQKSSTGPNKSSASRAISKQVERELAEEARLRRAVEEKNAKLEQQYDSAPLLPCILLVCPFCSSSVPKQQIDLHMLDCLRQQYEEEPSIVSITMFLSCNRNPDKLAAGKDVFLRILNNIATSPEEDKFRKLRTATNSYQEKVKPMLGCEELLKAAGFRLQSVQQQDGSEDEQWVLARERLDVPTVQNMVLMLTEGTAMVPSLDRQTKVLRARDLITPGCERYPDDFYNLTKEEIAREQALRRERVEKNAQLRTKAMRERDALQEVRKYNYTLIRVRFPDNLILQAVFRAFERLRDVRSFVCGCVAYENVPFRLVDATGASYDEEEAFLADLALVPAALLNFQWDPEALQQVAPTSQPQYLAPEYLALCPPPS